jgi:hypothetical protein
LAFPAKNKGSVVSTTAKDQKEPGKDGSQSGTESGVVVPGASPRRETVLHKIVIAFTSRAAEDIGDSVQTLRTLMSLLNRSIDFSFRGPTVNMHSRFASLRFTRVFGAIGDESALDLVGVEEFRLFTVGLV